MWPLFLDLEIAPADAVPQRLCLLPSSALTKPVSHSPSALSTSTSACLSFSLFRNGKIRFAAKETQHDALMVLAGINVVMGYFLWRIPSRHCKLLGRTLSGAHSHELPAVFRGIFS